MRKDPLEIIEEIFKALELGGPFSINELSKKTGLHNLTVKRYIRVIETVRKEPEIEIITTRHSIILRVRNVATVQRVVQSGQEKDRDKEQ